LNSPIETCDGSEIVIDEQRRDADNQGAMHHHEHRYVDTRWDEHRWLEIRARLTPEQGDGTSAEVGMINNHRQHMRRLGLPVEMIWTTV